MRDEPLGLAQEGALALHPTKLLQERQGDDLRVRELLEGLVASSTGVEQQVSVVHEAEEDGQGLFWSRRGVGYGWAGPSFAPSRGREGAEEVNSKV